MMIKQTILPTGLLLLSTFLATQLPAKSAVVFDFSSNPATNFSSKVYSSSGIDLSISNSNSTGALNNNTFNTNSSGLCAWASVGTSAGRCGYGNTDPTGGISSFQASFSKSVILNSFNVTYFPSHVINQGNIEVSFDNINFMPASSFTSTGTESLSGFEIAANQNFFIKTSANFTTANQTGIFRINNLNVTDVPGPLSILGLGAALGWSRKIKKKFS